MWENGGGAQHGITGTALERPVRKSGRLGPKALEEGLKEPDPDGSPGAKKGDGLVKDGVGPLGTQKIPFGSGGAEETLDPPEVGQAVFLEQVFD